MQPFQIGLPLPDLLCQGVPTIRIGYDSQLKLGHVFELGILEETRKDTDLE